MICKETENMIQTLLRLKDSPNDNNNKIASIMSKSHNYRTKEEKEDLCVHVLNQLMGKNQNKNKIASVHQPTPKMGEVAEFQRLLHTHLQKFSPQEL